MFFDFWFQQVSPGTMCSILERGSQRGKLPPTGQTTCSNRTAIDEMNHPIEDLFYEMNRPATKRWKLKSTDLQFMYQLLQIKNFFQCDLLSIVY